MRPPEGGVALDDEDGMAADDDGKGDPGQARDGSRPEAGRIDDDRRVDALACGRLDAADAVGRRADRYHLHALLDADAASTRRLGIAGRHRGRVAVARLQLIENGAEVLGIDSWLDAHELARLQHLGTDAERPLEPHRLLELGTYRGGDADQGAAADVARLAADGVAEALKDGERPHDDLAAFWRRVELADDPDRPAGSCISSMFSSSPSGPWTVTLTTMLSPSSRTRGPDRRIGRDAADHACPDS